MLNHTIINLQSVIDLISTTIYHKYQLLKPETLSNIPCNL